MGTLICKGALILASLFNRLRWHQYDGEDYTLFTIEEMGTGEERKVSGAVLESKLADIADGTRVLLTYKGKPKGTYLDFSVMEWKDEPAP